MSGGITGSDMLTWDNIKWFKSEEFDDRHKINLGKDMDMETVHRLDSLRGWVACPIIITAGYDSQGHSSDSYHYKGKAVDFIICSDMAMREQWQYIKISGFNGIGVYPEWKVDIRGKTFKGGFHLDTRDIPQVWRQVAKGEYFYLLP